MAIFEFSASILTPMDDRIFKLLLTHPDYQDVLMDIITSVIGYKVTDVAVKNNEIPATDTGEKQERLDVNCTVDGGDQVNVEMQASSMPEKIGGNHKNLKNKAVYYLCDLHSGQSSIGKSYDEMARTIQITFCAYTVFPRKEGFVHEFSLRDNEGAKLSDAVSVVFIELSKLGKILTKPVAEMTSLEMWSVFFRYADDPIRRNVVNEIIEAKEEINMASTLLASISQDERERAIQMSRRKYQTDMESERRTLFREGKLEGMREGKREGVREGKLDAAKKMKHANIPLAQIIEFTGLTEDEIINI